MHVALQIFSFKENGLYNTLDAYAGLPTPPFVDELDRTVAITPRESLQMSQHRAQMVEQAEAHPEFDVFRTGQGKIRSRNEAHDRAVENGADVIVVGDADGPPLHDAYLHRLLQPFQSADVVATNSMPITTSPLGLFINVATFLEDTFRPHMHGQGSAFRAGAWQAAGPFVEDLDQTDIDAVRSEEEFRFRHRLEDEGAVVQTAALVENDSRRIDCKIQRSNLGIGRRTAHCQRSTDSSVTFHPRRDQDDRGDLPE